MVLANYIATVLAIQAAWVLKVTRALMTDGCTFFTFLQEIVSTYRSNRVRSPDRWGHLYFLIGWHRALGLAARLPGLASPALIAVCALGHRGATLDSR